MLRFGLLWLALLVFAAGAAGADELSGEAFGESAKGGEARWRVGVLLEGSWSHHEIETQAAGNLVISFFNPFTITLGGKEKKDIDLEGFEGSASARLWFPVRLCGAQPWLQAGYRYAFDDLEETGAVSHRMFFNQILPSPAADLLVEYEGGAHVKLGLDFGLELAGHPLTLSPVIGWERSEYELMLRRYGLFGSVAWKEKQDRDVHAASVGLEARTPLYQRGRFGIELTLAGDYLYGFGSESIKIDWVGFAAARGRMEVEDVYRASLGLLFRY